MEFAVYHDLRDGTSPLEWQLHSVRGLALPAVATCLERGFPSFRCCARMYRHIECIWHIEGSQNLAALNCLRTLLLLLTVLVLERSVLVSAIDSVGRRASELHASRFQPKGMDSTAAGKLRLAATCAATGGTESGKEIIARV